MTIHSSFYATSRFTNTGSSCGSLTTVIYLPGEYSWFWPLHETRQTTPCLRSIHMWSVYLSDGVTLKFGNFSSVTISSTYVYLLTCLYVHNFITVLFLQTKDMTILLSTILSTVFIDVRETNAWKLINEFLTWMLLSLKFKKVILNPITRKTFRQDHIYNNKDAWKGLERKPLRIKWMTRKFKYIGYMSIKSVNQ